MRRRHGGAALVDVGELGVIRAVEAVHGQGEDVLTGCGDIDPRAVVGERRSLAFLGGCANRDDAHAVGGRVLGCFRVAVTRRGDHECTLGACNVDGALVGGGAPGYGADGHVDDLGGVGVVRHAVNVSAGCPDNRVGNVGGAATTAAQHAHGLHAGEVGDADDAHAVVTAGTDNARHVGAVPGGGVGVRLVLAEVVGRVVAFIHGVGVAAVAVAGTERVADEVVAVRHAGDQVGVRHVAGVEHGDLHVCAAAQASVTGVLHAGGGVGEVPLLAVLRVVELEGDVAFCGGVVDVVGLDGCYVRVGGDLRHELLCLVFVEGFGGLDDGVIGGGTAQDLSVNVQRFTGNINGVFNVISNVLDCIPIAFVLLLTLLGFVGVGDDESVEVLLGKRAGGCRGGGGGACYAVACEGEGADGAFNLGRCLSCCQDGFVAGCLREDGG